MQNIRDAHVSGRSLHYGHPDQKGAASVLNSHIGNSSIVLQGTGGMLRLWNATITDSRIEGRRAHQQFLTAAVWERCEFVGVFTDCVFGVGTDGERGEVRDCSFVDAQLRLVSFRGGLDYASCTWPSWPTAVFRSSPETLPILRALPLPPDLSDVIAMGPVTDEDHLALDLSRFGADPDNLWAIVHDCPAVLVAPDGRPPTPGADAVASAAALFRAQQERAAKHRELVILTQSVSIIGIEYGEEHIDLKLKTAESSPFDTPAEFVARLTGNASCERAQGDGDAVEASPALSGTFRLMGYQSAHDHSYVDLKGHRKALGRLRLRFDAVTFVDRAGKPLPSPLPFRTWET